MVVKESWCLASYFSSSSTFCLQYRLSSWLFLLKSPNSYNFSFFKSFPMVAASRYMMNQLWYHMICKWYAYSLSITPTWIFKQLENVLVVSLSASKEKTLTIVIIQIDNLCLLFHDHVRLKGSLEWWTWPTLYYHFKEMFITHSHKKYLQFFQ